MKTKQLSFPAPVSQKIFQSPAWVVAAAFGTYFCMYGFRKPYTAASFEGVPTAIDYKFLLIIAQTSGYVLSKWFGIKIVSEIQPHRRIKMLFILIGFSEVMLLLFAITPAPWNIGFMFLNGLPLGIVFGLVLGFMEGRQNTEFLIAGLCASFIVSDGVSKSVGALLLEHGVSEMQMPFAAGLFFLVPLLIFAGMLSLVPPPTAEDVASRSIRQPMRGKDRKSFFLKFAPGLIAISFVYLLVTLLRSVRGDFAAELWTNLGYTHQPALFTQTELIVSFVVLVLNGLGFLIRDHRKAMQFSIVSCGTGFVLLLIAIFGLNQGTPGFIFILLSGLGVYLPYVAIHTTVFERLIAITRERANIGFLMYIVDAVGYTGYIILMLVHESLPHETALLGWFLRMTAIIAVAGAVLTIYCRYYFTRKLSTS